MSNGPEWQKKEQTRPYGTFFCGPGAGRGSLRTAVQQGNADGGCVRVRKKGLSPKRKPLNLLERETGFEPATSTLARLHSTTELLPQNEGVFITDSAFRQAFFAKKENFFCRTRRGKALHRVRGCCTQQRLCCFSTCCVRIVRRVAPFFLVWGLSAVFVIVRLRREVNPA